MSRLTELDRRFRAGPVAVVAPPQPSPWSPFSVGAFASAALAYAAGPFVDGGSRLLERVTLGAFAALAVTTVVVALLDRLRLVPRRVDPTADLKTLRDLGVTRPFRFITLLTAFGVAFGVVASLAGLADGVHEAARLRQSSPRSPTSTCGGGGASRPTSRPPPDGWRSSYVRSGSWPSRRR